MLLGIAIAVGFGGGLVLLASRRPPLPPPPPDTGHQIAIENGVAGDTGSDSGGDGAKPPAKPEDTAPRGPSRDVKDGLKYAKEVASAFKGDAAALVNDVLKETVVAAAHSQEAKVAAGIGVAAAGVVAGGVGAAVVSGSLASYAASIGAATGPVGLAIVTAAVVITAVVVNLIDIAVALDHERQRGFLQPEIDKLVAAGQLRDAWATTVEARKRGIAVGFMVGVPTWGDAKECVQWPPPGENAGGMKFLDAEEVIRGAYAAAHHALALDLKLPWVKNAAGDLVRPRTNRDKPDAVASRSNGDAWCRYIGSSHSLSGFYEVVDEAGNAKTVSDGLTPWQPAEMLIRAYAPHDPPDAKTQAQQKAAKSKGTFAATSSGRVRTSTPTAAPGTGAPAPTSSDSAPASGSSSSTNTGGGHAHAGDTGYN